MNLSSTPGYHIVKLPCKKMAESKIYLIAVLTIISMVQETLADEAAPASYVSFEDNLRTMDADKDGMVSVHEVRAALEARHGKGYEQSLLADMEASASGRSCSTPFAQNFY